MVVTPCLGPSGSWLTRFNHDPVHSLKLFIPQLTLPGGRPPTLVPEAGAVLQPRMEGHARFNKTNQTDCLSGSSVSRSGRISPSQITNLVRLSSSNGSNRVNEILLNPTEFQSRLSYLGLPRFARTADSASARAAYVTRVVSGHFNPSL